MENKKTENTIMILDFSIKGKGSNKNHTSYQIQEVNNNTDVEELIRSILVDYRGDTSHWDMTSFKVIVSTYIKEDGKDLNDYNEYDNDLLNVDKYDANNIMLDVGWVNLVEYREDEDDKDSQLTWQGDIYPSQDAAIRNIDDDVNLAKRIGGANIIISIKPCKIEIDAYADIHCYDAVGNCIYHDFIQGYWGD